MTDDPQPRVASEALEHLVDSWVCRAVQDHQHLELGEVLIETAADRLREVAVTVVCGDPERDAGQPMASRDIAPMIGTTG